MLEELKVSALHFFDVIAMLKELKVTAKFFHLLAGTFEVLARFLTFPIEYFR